MNRIILIIGSFILLFGFTACEEDLTLFPENQKIPDFSDIGDFEEVLIGAYGGWTAGGAWGANLYTLDAWLGDDMDISPQNNGQGAFLHNWTYSDGDGTFSGSWSRLYINISRANLLIEESGNISGPRIQQIVAEAKVLRAYGHLELYKLFGQRYGDGNSMGVPYVTSTLITNEPSRLTSRETLDFIEQDLEEALAVLDPASGVYDIGPVFAEGLLARVAMYREDWSDVVNHTTNVINQAPPIASDATYTAMWDGSDAVGENIFKFAFTTNDADIGDIFWIISLNAPYFNPSDKMLEEVYGNPNPFNDIRYTEWFDQTRDRVVKYINTSPGAPNPNNTDAKVMRTSEMYLLRAEAYYNLGQEGSALQDLDAIRSERIRAFNSPGETGQDLYDAIKLERRRELAYEGFRVFDLKRWGDPIVRNDDCPAVECMLPAEDYRFVFPIPADETFANENIGCDVGNQNPGWCD